MAAPTIMINLTAIGEQLFFAEPSHCPASLFNQTGRVIDGKQRMPRVTIDAIEGVACDSEQFGNECRTLHYLRAGIFSIASQMKAREDHWYRLLGHKFKIDVFGTDVDGSTDGLDLLACWFHWFGVSVCNYCRLVGFLRGLSLGDFARSDLAAPTQHQTIKSSVDQYVGSVVEIDDVRVWRNKVGAHFAITDPRTNDNISSLEMSVMFPVSFSSDRYRVHEMTLRRKTDSGIHVSAIPSWSITEVYEAIAKRYWPDCPLSAVPGSPHGNNEGG